MFPFHVDKKFHFLFDTNESLIVVHEFSDAASEMKEAFLFHIFSFQLFCDFDVTTRVYWKVRNV